MIDVYPFTVDRPFAADNLYDKPGHIPYLHLYL